MGQFKPMPKMATTEPSVELKLKKGGTVAKKAVGGAMSAGAIPAVIAKGGRKPVPRAARASMAGMPALAKPTAAPTGALPLKKGGKATGGKLQKEIRNESEEIGRVKARLIKHEDKAASKAHKGLKTGGVVNGQGGYKTGGVVNGQGGYKKGGCVEPKMKRGGKC